MKSPIISLIASIALVSSSITFAQTKEENHAQLTGYHKKAMEYASKSVEGTSSKEAHNMNAEEAGKNLESARMKHNDLKKYITEERKPLAQPHYDAIEKYHGEAKAHNENMKAEAARSNYDEKKVREHAKKMLTSVNNAEKEHQKLKSKTSK
jgi:hypothetical protein